MKLLVGIAVCLLFALASAASAGDKTVMVASVSKNLQVGRQSTALPPLVSERYEYYDVQGSCEKDLRCDLGRKGIPWDDGNRYESVTSWHVKWHYGYTADSQACTADGFQVDVNIVFRYPRWNRTENAPSALADKWYAYMKNLVVHENEHRDMAIRAAEELSGIISTMPPSRTCADLDQAVRTLSQKRMKKLNDDERLYDEATNHGATQGAIFR